MDIVCIFDYFEERKEDLFKYYTEPKYLLKAFERQSNRLGFIKRMLTRSHPKLKTITDYKTMEKPTFHKCHDIHSFIADYIEWLNEEFLINTWTYTDKENINYILKELDERFTTAKSKIETEVNSIYAIPSRPKEFPEYLKISSELSIYIMDLIPEEEQSRIDYTNQQAIVNKVNASSGYKQKYKKKDSFNKPVDPDWSSKIKWELIPGANCSACGQNNHEVYKTGCLALAVFCKCKKFYEQTEAKHLLPILNQFAQFKAEQQKKQASRQKELKGTFKLLQGCGKDNEIKEAIKQQYLNEFPEEMYSKTQFEDYDDDNDNQE